MPLSHRLVLEIMRHASSLPFDFYQLASMFSFFQNNRLCEEIREDSSPPVEVSSADAFPKTCQRARVENLELYSLVTYPRSKVSRTAV